MIKMKTKKLNGLTKMIALMLLSSLVMFTGCNAYDDEVQNLQGQIDGVVTEVSALKTSVAALQTSVSGMTYIKSIALGTDGKLTITPSTGNPIVYDAKNYVTYDIKLEDNKLYVNGQEKGSVTIPALTFNNGKLMSGTTEVADLTNFFKSALTLGADNYLYINGQKTTVMVPPATVQSVDVKDVSISGNTLTFTKNDGTKVTINLPANTITLGSAYDAATGTLTLTVNGIETKVVIKNTYGVQDGFLTVNGVKTTVAIPAANTSSIIINKDNQGNILSATVSDGKDAFTVKVNPTNELLSSILFVPSWIDGGVNAIEVGFINGITAPVGKVLFNEATAVYRFNPTTADVSKTTWAIVNNSARLTAAGQNAPGDKTTLFAAPAYTSNNDGSGTFKLKVGTWVEPAAGQTHLIALQANGTDFYSGKPTSVVSDYAKVVTAQYNAFISDAKKSNSTTNVYVHYRTAVPAIGAANDFELVIDTPVDMDDLVWATADKGGAAERRFETYGFNDYKYEFSLPNYLGLDGVTNQNSFVTLDATTNVLAVKAGSSVLDRNPLVLVKLLTLDNKLVAQSYVKFKIVNTPTVPPTPGEVIKYTVKAATAINYNTLFKDNVAGVSAGDYQDLALTWGDINNYIYNPLGLTHNEFQAKYGPVNPTVKVNGVAATLAQYPLDRSILAPDVDTYAMKYKITPNSKFGTTQVVYLFDTGVATEDKVEITFEFTINRPTLDKAIVPAYQYTAPAAYTDVTTDAAHTVFTQGIKYTTPATEYKMELNLGEGFGFGSAALHNMFGVGANKIDPATQEFIVTNDKYKVGATASYLFSQAAASQTSLTALLGTSNSTGVKMGINPAVPLTTEYRAYPVNFKTTYPNGEVDNFNYTVVFKNPLTVELESTADFNLLDVVTGAKDQIDLSKNYVVKMLGEVVFNKNGVVAAKAAEYGIVSTQTYAASNVTAGFASAFSFVSPIATWENAGTKLTSTQKLADADFTFTTNFASVKRKDAINVNPDLSQGARRK